MNQLNHKGFIMARQCFGALASKRRDVLALKCAYLLMLKMMFVS